MNKCLTASELDERLLVSKVNHRYAADVDGYTVIYNCFNAPTPDNGGNCILTRTHVLLKARAVLQAIDSAGSVPGVPLQSYQVPLLVAELRSLQTAIQADDQQAARSRGGSAGRGRSRSAAIATIRKAFRELSPDAPTDDILYWLENETCHCELKDGRYFFNFLGSKDASFDRRATLKKISDERPKN